MQERLGINDNLRKHTETTEWEFQEVAKFLNTVGDLAMERFFNGLVYPNGKKVPNPVTAFDNLRNQKVLACYDLYPDEYGVLYKITHNTEQYEKVENRMISKWGRWGQAETHIHEMIHAWQQTVGKDPYKSGRNSHNTEFCNKAKQLGLNVFPVIGFHYAPADINSPFDILMRDMGIQRPPEVEIPEGKPKSDWFRPKPQKGRSTLSKWSCGCQNVRVGTAEFKAHCDICNNPFVKVETKAIGMLGMTKE